jgi:hypothetical protein
MRKQQDYQRGRKFVQLEKMVFQYYRIVQAKLQIMSSRIAEECGSHEPPPSFKTATHSHC